MLHRGMVNNMVMLHNIEMALKNMGYDLKMLKNFIDTARDGQEALDMFKAKQKEGNPYILMFMDCSMEPMDGYTSTSLIKKYC